MGAVVTVVVAVVAMVVEVATVEVQRAEEEEAAPAGAVMAVPVAMDMAATAETFRRAGPGDELSGCCRTRRPQR